LQRELLRRGWTVPVIFITAQSDEKIRAVLLSSGAVGYLIKPFTEAELRAALATALGTKYRANARLPEVHGRIYMNALMTLHPRTTSMSDTKPVVYVVDDDISIRESVETMVAEAGFQPEAFASAGEFLRHVRQPLPGCLILDVSLPDLNGLELQRLMGRSQTALPIVFVTGHGDIPMTVQAMRAGAIEFLTKPFSPEALLAAVCNAIERSRAHLAEQLVLKTLQARQQSLSRRERDVMALVVRGQMNKQVGAALGISEITVKAHRGQVMRKMQARSLADLVTMAARLRQASEEN
jgi:FixJ family two-component response regulator